MRPELEQILKETKSLLCLDCGKCTGSCPISRQGVSYSPRLHIARMVYGYEDEVLADMDMWSCLTCGMCETKCPSGVKYTDFIERVRVFSAKEHHGGFCAHAGITHALSRWMANDGHAQKRLDWLEKGHDTAESGEILYFVGCLPYQDTIFENIGIEGTKIAKNTVELLNKLGIKPVVMKNEVCCGHDLLWSGDLENFKRLVKRNVEAIAKTGAKMIVTSCAECLRTLKVDYPKFTKFGISVRHISEFLAERIETVPVEMKNFENTITFQDPCRLGRHLKIYEPPRRALGKVPGLKLVEMESNRENSTCCGTTQFLNCGTISEGIRKESFAEALKTGAQMMVTACPKCQIHLKCSQSNRMQEEGVEDLRIVDFTTIMNEHMTRK